MKVRMVTCAVFGHLTAYNHDSEGVSVLTHREHLCLIGLRVRGALGLRLALPLAPHCLCWPGGELHWCLTAIAYTEGEKGR